MGNYLPILMLLLAAAYAPIHGTSPTTTEDPRKGYIVDSTKYPSVVDVIQQCTISRGNLDNWDVETSARLGVMISRDYVLLVASTKPRCNYTVSLVANNRMDYLFAGSNSTEFDAERILYSNPEEKAHFIRDPVNGMALLKLNGSVESSSRYQPVEISEESKLGDEGSFVGPASLEFAGWSKFAECNCTVISAHECAPHIRYTFTRPAWQNENDLLPPGYFCVRSNARPPCDVSPLFMQGKVAGFERKELYTDSHVDNRGILKYTIIYNATYYSPWIKNITGV